MCEDKECWLLSILIAEMIHWKYTCYKSQLPVAAGVCAMDHHRCEECYQPAFFGLAKLAIQPPAGDKQAFMLLPAQKRQAADLTAILHQEAWVCPLLLLPCACACCSGCLN